MGTRKALDTTSLSFKNRERISFNLDPPFNFQHDQHGQVSKFLPPPFPSLFYLFPHSSFPLSCTLPSPLPSLCSYYTLTATSLSRASPFSFTSSPPPPSPLLPASSLSAPSYCPTSSIFFLSCAVSRDTSCRHCSPRRLSDAHTPCNSVT